MTITTRRQQRDRQPSAGTARRRAADGSALTTILDQHRRRIADDLDQTYPIGTTPPPGRAPVPGSTVIGKLAGSGDSSKLGRSGSRKGVAIREGQQRGEILRKGQKNNPGNRWHDTSPRPPESCKPRR